MTENSPIVCPKCKADKRQILVSIDLEGGHRVDWQQRQEWDFARAFMLMTCGICEHEYSIKHEWRK